LVAVVLEGPGWLGGAAWGASLLVDFKLGVPRGAVIF